MNKYLVFAAMAAMSFGQTTTWSGGWIQQSGSFITTAPNNTFVSSGTCAAGTVTWSGNNATSAWTWMGPEDRPRNAKFTISQVKMSAKPLSKDSLAPMAYVSLAKSIGLESVATDEARLIQIISDLNLPVYDYNQVDNYLYNITLTMKHKMRWVWKGLRESDVKALTAKALHESTVNPPVGFGIVRPVQYSNKVPASALNIAAKILEKAPDAVFLVSDYEAIKPDPFLAVTTPRLAATNKLWIIHQWDEPGFGEIMPGYSLGFPAISQ